MLPSFLCVCRITGPHRLLWFSLLTAVIGLIGAAGCGEKADVPGKGMAGSLDCRNGETIYLSNDPGTYEQLVIFLRAERANSVQNLIAQGRVVTCVRGTTVTVVNPGRTATTVRITSGTHSGKTGLVANECLRR